MPWRESCTWWSTNRKGRTVNQSMLRAYKTMARVQNIISNSETIDVALRGGMRAIVDEMDAEVAEMFS